MPNIFMPELPQGSSFTQNPQRVGMMKNLAESLGVMVEEARKQQQYNHETSMVEQIASGRPVTGTRAQAPRSGLQGITDQFNPNAPYSGGMSQLEMEYKTAPMRDRLAQQKLDRETEAKIKFEQAKPKAQVSGKERRIEVLESKIQGGTALPKEQDEYNKLIGGETEPTALQKLQTMKESQGISDNIIALYTDKQTFPNVRSALAQLDKEYDDLIEVFGEDKVSQIYGNIINFWENK